MTEQLNTNPTTDAEIKAFIAAGKERFSPFHSPRRLMGVLYDAMERIQLDEERDNMPEEEYVQKFQAWKDKMDQKETQDAILKEEQKTYHVQLTAIGFKLLNEEYPNLGNMPEKKYMMTLGGYPSNKKGTQKIANKLKDKKAKPIDIFWEQTKATVGYVAKNIGENTSAAAISGIGSIFGTAVALPHYPKVAVAVGFAVGIATAVSIGVVRSLLNFDELREKQKFAKMDAEMKHMGQWAEGLLLGMQAEAYDSKKATIHALRDNDPTAFNKEKHMKGDAFALFAESIILSTLEKREERRTGIKPAAT